MSIYSDLLIHCVFCGQTWPKADKLISWFHQHNAGAQGEIWHVTPWAVNSSREQGITYTITSFKRFSIHLKLTHANYLWRDNINLTFFFEFVAIQRRGVQVRSFPLTNRSWIVITVLNQKPVTILEEEEELQCVNQFLRFLAWLDP